MRIKVSDLVAAFFAENGIKTVFTVVGGGAMHLNDSLGHHRDIECIYNHHEQACAIAAEAYFRVHNQMAGVCVTSGPGAINALNGVAGAYQDSIPMLVVSGQTKTSLMTVNSGLNLRTLGNQEFDIMSTLSKMTKYAQTVMKPNDILFCLEKAFYLAKQGRPGPCWIEIPIDVQGAYVDTECLEHYQAPPDTSSDSMTVLQSKMSTIIARIKEADRPVLYAGNGIRISGAAEAFAQLTDRLGIPVVTCWDSIDLMETDHHCYVGRGGIMGDRPGNFAVQNSDLLIAVGSRLNIYQVGYQVESWAREAYVVVVDIDPLELQKKTVRIDLPVCADASEFIWVLAQRLDEDSELAQLSDCPKMRMWRQQCQLWKQKYPVVQEKHKRDASIVNVYAFMDRISKSLPIEAVTVVANGSASVVGSAAYYIGKRQRFIMNCGLSSMGYDLPAAIGACVANDRNPIICIAGDGSIMMNLQELQTIVTNQLPVKIVLLNNSGYQQIRITQTNLFQKNFVGIGPDSKDLGFPSFEKIAFAFGIPYQKCEKMGAIDMSLEWLLDQKSFCMLEVFCSTDQKYEPKSATKRLEDGTLISPPLEDLAPFLPREEIAENMYIPMWK